jgi:hypothetical protein
LYSGVKIEMMGKVSAAGSLRWASSAMLDGQYRARLPKKRRLKKPAARTHMVPMPCSFVKVRA